ATAVPCPTLSSWDTQTDISDISPLLPPRRKAATERQTPIRGSRLERESAWWITLWPGFTKCSVGSRTAQWNLSTNRKNDAALGMKGPHLHKLLGPVSLIRGLWEVPRTLCGCMPSQKGRLYHYRDQILTTKAQVLPAALWFSLCGRLKA